MSCSHKILLRAPQARQLILGIGLLVLCCSVPLLGGYKSVKVKVDRASTYPSYQRQGKVVIAADPYLTKEKIVTAFDAKDLEKLGIVPVNIILTNEGEEPVLLSGEDVTLLDSKNRSIGQIPAEEVVQTLLNKSRGTSRRPVPTPFPLPRRDGGQGEAFDLGTDFSNKSLKEARVAPDSTSFGFVFFQIQGNPKSLSGFKIYIPEVRNLKTKQNLLFFEIELK